jgi:hypothetical protein
LITRVHCVRRLYLKIDMHFDTTDSYEDHSSLDQPLRPIQNMAKLDRILNKYVKPKTAAQALQDAPFLVKNKDGVLVPDVRFHNVPLPGSLVVHLSSQAMHCTQNFGKAQLRVRIATF